MSCWKGTFSIKADYLEIRQLNSWCSCLILRDMSSNLVQLLSQTCRIFQWNLQQKYSALMKFFIDDMWKQLNESNIRQKCHGFMIWVSLSVFFFFLRCGIGGRQGAEKFRYLLKYSLSIVLQKDSASGSSTEWLPQAKPCGGCSKVDTPDLKVLINI